MAIAPGAAGRAASAVHPAAEPRHGGPPRRDRGPAGVHGGEPGRGDRRQPPGRPRRHPAALGLPVPVGPRASWRGACGSASSRGSSGAGSSPRRCPRAPAPPTGSPARAMIVRREVFEAIGPMDERLLPVFRGGRFLPAGAAGRLALLVRAGVEGRPPRRPEFRRDRRAGRIAGAGPPTGSSPAAATSSSTTGSAGTVLADLAWVGGLRLVSGPPRLQRKPDTRPARCCWATSSATTSRGGRPGHDDHHHPARGGARHGPPAPEPGGSQPQPAGPRRCWPCCARTSAPTTATPSSRDSGRSPSTASATGGWGSAPRSSGRR